MKKISSLCFFLTAAFCSNSQSTAGLTGVTDTSYNINTEYRKLQKLYPYLQIVKESKSTHVKGKRGVVYCKEGSRKLLLDIFSPNIKPKNLHTAIILIHGGGWRSGNRSLFYPLAQRLAVLGYVCITPEYRLSTEALYPAGVYDVKAVVQWVKKNAKKLNIDTSKIVAAGHSAGGELAAFMGTTNNISSFDGNKCNSKYSSRVNAVIDIDGILAFIHPESGEGDDSKNISAATNWFGYSKKDNLELWKQASPLTHADNNTPPTLFINSSVDRMHAGRDDYIKILNSFNIYTEVHNIENAPHSFCLFNPWFEPTIKYIDGFLKKVFINK